MASNDTYEYDDYEAEEEEEADFSWYQIQDALHATSGHTDDPNTFDPEGWSVYWDEETWEYYNENFDNDHPEADKNDTLFIECIKGATQNACYGREALEELQEYQLQSW